MVQHGHQESLLTGRGKVELLMSKIRQADKDLNEHRLLKPYTMAERRQGYMYLRFDKNVKNSNEGDYSTSCSN